MGATTALIALTAATGATQVMSGQAQRDAIKQQRDLQIEQTRNQAKEEQIKRLQSQRALHDQNIVKAMGSGFTMSGSQALALDANRTLAEQDITMIQGNAANTIGSIDREANAALNANTMNTIGSLVGTVASAGMQYAGVTADTKKAQAASKGTKL